MADRVRPSAKPRPSRLALAAAIRGHLEAARPVPPSLWRRYDEALDRVLDAIPRGPRRP